MLYKRFVASMVAVFLSLALWADNPLKPDLVLKDMRAVSEGRRTVLEVSVLNDSSYNLDYPAYKMILTAFEDGVERATMEPDFGEWRGNQSKSFRFPLDIANGRTYRVQMRVEGLFGESNKENNVLEAVPGVGDYSHAPPDTEHAYPDRRNGTQVSPSSAWAGSPVLVEADRQGQVRVGNVAVTSSWTNSGRNGRGGRGYSTVITIPASLRPGRTTVTLSSGGSSQASADITILAMPPRIRNSPDRPVPGSAFNLVIDNVEASQVSDLVLQIGGSSLRASRHSVRKDGGLNVTFNAPSNQTSGEMSLELGDSSSLFWDHPRLVFAGRPDLYGATVADHPATRGSLALVWGAGLTDSGLTWWIDNRQATVVSSASSTNGRTFILLSSDSTAGKTIEARAGRTRAAWLDVDDTFRTQPEDRYDNDHGYNQAVIDDFEPGSVRRGEQLTIFGQHLESADRVTVGGGACDIISRSDSRLVVRVGPNTSTGAIVVETNEGIATSALGVYVR